MKELRGSKFEIIILTGMIILLVIMQLFYDEVFFLVCLILVISYVREAVVWIRTVQVNRREDRRRRTYETLSGDGGTIKFTEEGTKAFFEMLKQPNPARDKILEESRGILTEEQLNKFGKERVYFNFKLKKEK